jgi:hypothetical protein
MILATQPHPSSYTRSRSITPNALIEFRGLMRLPVSDIAFLLSCFRYGLSSPTAHSIASSKAGPSTGFRKNATAPACRARCRVFSSSSAVTMITGMEMPLEASSACRLIPVSPGIRRSNTIHALGVWQASARKVEASPYSLVS